MATVAHHIPNLLDKMISSDKDLRFMATNDLISELQRNNIKLDDESERKIVRMILQLLEDRNGEVQNLTVKCIGLLVTKVRDTHVEMIVDTLCNNMLADSEPLRDISCIGLKTVVAELAPSGCADPAAVSATPARADSPAARHVSVSASSNLQKYVCRRVIVWLCKAITMLADVSMQLEILDIMADLLSKFGSMLTSYHASILEALLPQLAMSRLAVRKRVITTLGCLVHTCDIKLYSSLTEHLLSQLADLNSANTVKLGTYISAVAAISRESGHRFGEYLGKCVPLIIKHLETADDDELKEQCFVAMEAFVHKCPKEVSVYISDILNSCLHYLSHDPNYNYSCDTPPLSSGHVGDLQWSVVVDHRPDPEEEEEDDEQEDYSDDDDMSWKVRRAAARCLNTIIMTRHEMLLYFYQEVSPKLISRFKEREQSVKTDIYQVYTTLLTLLHKSRATGADNDEDAELEPTHSPLHCLRNQVPYLLHTVHTEFRSKTPAARLSVFALLRQLTQVLPAALSAHIALILSAIMYSLRDKTVTSAVRISALQLYHSVLLTHPHSIFYPHIADTIPVIIGAVNDPFYKISSEALLVLQQTVCVACPTPDTQQQTHAQPLHHSLVASIFQVIESRLRVCDVDQEVRERSITCAAHVLSLLSAQLAPGHTQHVSACLVLLTERLHNEITRLAAVRALTHLLQVAPSTASSASQRFVLETIRRRHVGCIVQCGAVFLRKHDRVLRVATLRMLRCLLLCCDVPAAVAEEEHSGSGGGTQFTCVLGELCALLSVQVCATDCDTQLTRAVVNLLAVVYGQASTRESVLLHERILPAIFQLMCSPLLQTAMLNEVTHFLSVIVSPPGAGIVSAEQLLSLMTSHTGVMCVTAPTAPATAASTVTVTAMSSDTLVGGCRDGAPQSRQLGKQAYSSISQCLAAIVQADQAVTLSVISRCVEDVRECESEATQLFSLLSLAEIGKRSDLGTIIGLCEVVVSVFESRSEDLKLAASYALGAFACANLDAFLPYILNSISAAGKRQYWFLHSLKEVLVWCSGQPRTRAALLSTYCDVIWEQLVTQCACADSGLNGAVAECLGRLTVMHADQLIPRLHACLLSHSRSDVTADTMCMTSHCDDVTQMRNTRCTLIGAFRHTLRMTHNSRACDLRLGACMGDFLRAVGDSDIQVRRIALLAFNSAAHNKPQLVKQLLGSLLPSLYEETKIKKELIREVEMGPFRHTIDDGLDLRKAAYECMYTLLDSCLEHVDVFVFLLYVEQGMRDDSDIKMLTHLMLTRMCCLVPHAVLQRMDSLVEALRATCSTKLKQNSVKQEHDKQCELKKSALRVISTLVQIPDADKNIQLCDYLTQIKSNQELSVLYSLYAAAGSDSVLTTTTATHHHLPTALSDTSSLMDVC